MFDIVHVELLLLQLWWYEQAVQKHQKRSSMRETQMLQSKRDKLN